MFFPILFISKKKTPLRSLFVSSIIQNTPTKAWKNRIEKHSIMPPFEQENKQVDLGLDPWSKFIHPRANLFRPLLGTWVWGARLTSHEPKKGNGTQGRYNLDWNYYFRWLKFNPPTYFSMDYMMIKKKIDQNWGSDSAASLFTKWWLWRHPDEDFKKWNKLNWQITARSQIPSGFENSLAV